MYGNLTTLALLIILPLIASCALTSATSPVTHDVCVIFSKKDFQYHSADTEDTKERSRSAYAAYKSVCPK